MDRIKDDIKKNSDRLQRHSDIIRRLESSQLELSKDSQRLNEVLTELKSTVEALNDTLLNIQLQPALRADKYRSSIWIAIIGIVVAYIFGKIF